LRPNSARWRATLNRYMEDRKRAPPEFFRRSKRCQSTRALNTHFDDLTGPYTLERR
jgi:hypothetical protein